MKSSRPKATACHCSPRRPKVRDLQKARDYLFAINAIDQSVYGLGELLDRSQSKAGIAYLPRLYASAPFCVVRIRFNALLKRMMICVPLAILGFGVFAWAANPPDKPPSRGVVLRITQ